MVDESEAQGPEDELVPVAPNMGAGGSHPQATLNQEWAERYAEWSSSWCVGKGNST